MIILNYKIYNLIENGTYGKVYRAKNLLTNEICAIKIYYDQGKIDDLRNEYDILSKLKHENIIHCNTYFEQLDKKYNKYGYLVMEYGELDLFEYLSKYSSTIIYINFIYDIIKGLEYIHSKNIVHCDIKLENIILVKNKAKIIDFGLSEKLIENTKSVNLVGTSGYMSPEIKYKGYCSKKSDIWSLGKLIQNIEIELIRSGYFYYPRLSNIFMKCFEDHHELRPSATELKNLFVKRYKDILYDIED